MAIAHAPRMRVFHACVAVVCALGCGAPERSICPTPSRPPADHLVALERAFSHVEIGEGVALASLADGSRWYLVTQPGVIYTFDSESSATVFVDVRDRVAYDGEAGLLGMALHPRFDANGEVFLSYTTPGGSGPFRSRISRMTSMDGGHSVDPSSENVVLEIDQPYVNHNGGGIGFGPDGYLYIGFGDGGAGGDPHGHGQNVDTLLGAMLRVDVDSSEPYGIPPDNPFANGGGRAEIFAWGLRNPWRWSFDRQTAKLWAGDVGQNLWEEIDIIERGKNYGWNIKEGPACFGTDSCDGGALTDPVIAYRTQGAASVVGGFVYRGRALPAIIGKYVYSDFIQGTMWAFGEGDAAPTLLSDSAGREISAYAEGPDGELFAVRYGGGIYRLVSAPTSDAPPLPARLSETGCVDMAAPRRAPEGLIGYDVNVPFWSDEASKTRWLALPTDPTIDVDASGDWDLPPGTVLVKSFWLGERPIETRLLVRHDDGDWAGYSYAWDEDQSDAALVVEGTTRTVDDRTWIYPSRSECLFCHSAAAGRSLGLESAQLSRTVIGHDGVPLDQLGWFADAGMLNATPAIAPLVPPEGDASIEARARAYLHANCSFCHRPEGPDGRADLDLRFTTALSDTGLCDAAPRAGDLDLPDARILAPGSPSRSVLSARMHSLGDSRMPPLASAIIDAEGTALIDDWIRSLQNCNHQL